MKDVLYKIIFLLLLLGSVFLVSCNQATDEPLEEHVYLQNDCTNYFFNLKSNYPTNVKGTCGYVSACSLFGFYNYYFNDNIVDEKYETNLGDIQGLKSAPYSEVSTMNSYEYYDYLKLHTDDYLQAFLITTVNENFLTDDGKMIFYDYSKKDPGTLYHGSSSRIKDNDCEIEVIMKYYLYKVMGFNEDYIKVNRIPGGGNKNELQRSNTIEIIKKGTPVLCALKDKKGNGHICIIYDYDETEDSMYCNLLTVDNYEHLKLSRAFKTMSYPLYISINQDKDCIAEEIYSTIGDNKSCF